MGSGYGPMGGMGMAGMGGGMGFHPMMGLVPAQMGGYMGMMQGVPAMRGGPSPAAAFRELPCVKLRGLPYSCSDNDIVDFFVGLDVVDVLMMHREGRFCGDAFVVLGTLAQVEVALQKHRQNMGRRYVEVFKSKRTEYYKAIASEVSMGHIPMSDAMAERPPGRVYEGADVAPRGRPAAPPRAADAPGGGEDLTSSGIVKMRGLPYSVTKTDIIDFFAGYSVQESNIFLVSARDGRLTGEAFVEFDVKEEAQAALGKDRGLIGTRYVELFMSSRDEAERVSQRK